MTSPLNARDFIDRIVADVRSGARYIPFTGSGISAASGILMGLDFTNFLANTVRLVLEKQHDLRSQGWPRHPDSKSNEETRQWVFSGFENVCKRLGYQVISEPGRLHFVTELKQNSDSSVSTGEISSLMDAFERPLVPQLIRSHTAERQDEVTRRVLRQLGRSANPHQPQRAVLSGAMNPNIVHAGIKSLCDWRETLRFLASIEFSSASGQKWVTLRQEPDQSLIDSFNTYITRDKQPNLAHKMLAHLAEPLRIRTVLSTNFDSLTEQAFEDFFLKLKVFPVSVKGGLPEPRAVRAQECLIKLHGDLLETRADPSLDQEPTEEDKARFAAYFSPGQVNLLVIGYSAADLRCAELIRHALDSTTRLNVYWISVTQSDVDRVTKLFQIYDQRVFVHRTARPDLLLYELYQRVALSLPPGGVTYEFSHSIPPAPFQSESHVRQKDVQSLFGQLKDDKGCNLIKAATAVLGKTSPDVSVRELARQAIVQRAKEAIVRRIAPPPEPDTSRDSSVSKSLSDTFDVRDTHSGLVFTIAAGAVRALRESLVELRDTHHRQCLWFELQDYPDADSLARDIMRVISLRLGRFQLQHVTLHPPATLKELCGKEESDTGVEAFTAALKAQFDELEVDYTNWTIFLYGRDAPGGCSSWFMKIWDKTAYEELWLLMKCLTRCGIGVIYAPLTPERAKRKQKAGEELAKQFEAEQENARHSAFIKARKADCNFASPDECGLESHQLEIHADRISTSRDIHSRIIYELKLRDEDRDKYQKHLFLYALTLFRQSRHPSALFSEGAYPCEFRFNQDYKDNDYERDKNVAIWIDQLKAARAIYEKPGGYVWMHRDVRLNLQRYLESRVFQVGEGTRFLGEELGRRHFWIGDWYFKAFAASGHFLPLLESLFHRFQAAKYACWSRPKSLKLETDGPAIYNHRFVLFRSAVIEILKALEIGRPWFKLWLASPVPLVNFSNFQEVETGLKEFHRRLSDGLSKVKGRKEPEEISLLARRFANISSALLSEGGALQSRPYLPPVQSTRPKDASPLEVSHTKDVVNAGEEAFADDFCKAFKRLKADENLLVAIQGEKDAKLSNGHSFEQRLSSAKAEWLLKPGIDASTVHQLVWLLGEYAYLLIRRAKLKYHAEGTIPSDLWRQVTIICNVGIDFCKHLHPAQLSDEMEFKIKLHSLYSLGLANLGRFYEAHRHLNEAHALLTKANLAGRETQLAIICLRRAEVFLTQNFWINQNLPNADKSVYEDQPDIKDALLLATSDDAWVQLDRAQSYLSGRSQSSLWWGRLATLRLRVFNALPEGDDLAKSSLVFRKDQSDLPLLHWFRMAYRIGSLDPIRRLRAIDYYWDARKRCRKLLGQESGQATDDSDREIKKWLTELKCSGGLLEAFREKVEEKVVR